jgi:hypothetical protein
MAEKNPRWFCQRLVAGDAGTRREDGTAVFSDVDIQQEREEGMPEEMIQQEYFCSFDAPFVGAYYGTAMLNAEKDGRIMEELPADPRLSVDTHWDLGVNDTTAIWFTQTHGMEVRVIDYYENSGEGLPHYARVRRGQVDKYERMGNYTYGVHNGPWDIVVRELGSGTSRVETARSLGIKFRATKKIDIDDGIEAVRNVLPMCYFNGKNCMRGIEALRQYRKEYDTKNKVFKSHPLHDWCSNGADAFRTFAVARRERPRTQNRPQDRAVDEHAYV